MPDSFGSFGSTKRAKSSKNPFLAKKKDPTVGERSLAALDWIADKLSRPQYAVTSGISAIQKGQDPLNAAVRGFTSPTSEDKSAWTNVMKNQGINTNTLPAKIVGGAANFALDPLLPLGVAGKTAKGISAAKTLSGASTLGKAAELGEKALFTYGFGERPLTLVKGTPVLKAMSKVGQAVKSIPAVKQINRAITGHTGIKPLDDALGRMRRGNIYQTGKSQELVNSVSDKLKNISKNSGIPVEKLSKQLLEHAEAPQHSSIYKNIPKSEYKALDKVNEMLPRFKKKAEQKASKLGVDVSQYPKITKEGFKLKKAQALDTKKQIEQELATVHPTLPASADRLTKLQSDLVGTEKDISALSSGSIQRFSKATQAKERIEKTIEDKMGKWKQAFTERRGQLAKEMHPDLVKISDDAAKSFDEMYAKEKDIDSAIRRTEGYFPHLFTDEFKTIIKGLSDNDPVKARVYGNSNKAAIHRVINGKTINELNQEAMEGKLVPGVKFKAYNDDAAYLWGMRTVGHAKFVNKDKMLKEVATGMGSPTPQAGFFPVVNKAWRSKENKDGRLFFPKETADELNKYITFIDNPDNLKEVEKILMTVSGIYKAYTLPLYPSYHVRNLVGNILNNALAGVTNPESYRKALLIQRGKPVTINKADGKTIMEWAKQDGVVGSGMFRLESGLPELVTPAKQGIKKALMGENKLVEKGREIGDFVETNARLAHYIDLLGKGYSREAARESVMTYLFDYCVDDKTQALTKRGWLNHDEITEQDEALTLNPKNNEIQWSKVLAVNVFRGIRNVVFWDSTRFSAASTKNHRWIFKGFNQKETKFRTTEELNLTKNTTAMIVVGGGEIKKKEHFFDDKFVELGAWFVSEGSLQTKGTGVQIHQSFKHNEAYCARIRDLADFYRGQGCTVSEYSRDIGYGDIRSFYFGRGIGEKLRNVFPEKQFSVDFLTMLSTSQLNLFYKTLMDGDGHRVKRSGTEIWAQKDVERVGTFQALCGMLGKRTASRYSEHTKCHQITAYVQNNLKATRLKKRIEVVDGIVWCPTTKNGTWMARRNGFTYWTGNSSLGWLSKKARLVMPFLAWTQKNLPLQLRKLVERPGLITGYSRGTEGFSGPDKPDERYFSEYMIENLPAYVKSKDGKDYYFLAGSWLPVSSINQFLGKGRTIGEVIGNTPRQTLETLTNMVAPYLKEPIAQSFNYDPFFKSDIQLFPGQKSKVNLPGGKQFDIPIRAKHAMGQFRPLADLSRVSDPGVGLGERLIQAGTGLKTQAVDPHKAKSSVLREKRAKLARYKSLLNYYNRDVGKNRLNIESLKKEMEKY